MKKAFSLVELIIVLIFVSIIMVSFAPVMTKKKEVKPTIQADSMPIGAIIYWYGTNYPKGWIPLMGQDLSDSEFEELKNALGGVEKLPYFNMYREGEDSMILIIKAKRR